ncbi:lecithin retinol acyltransferase family protein [[Clostridium] dakarense]|uniref:lecithin retinol acyltransferase family protein n=1 Tax=Faecalimicrobium dakarense TaxID=1301100 RepID=UPI0004B55BC6|nr:lecithin retinol acyltransferase family protein [[Clostridium] dakarense]
MSKANYGDIIYVNHLLYKHFGIYLSDDCIIHYDGKQDDLLLRKMCVRVTDIERFLNGKKTYKVKNIKNERYSPDEIVKRAKNEIGLQNFNIILNNCEHFANWCKTGNRKSNQVNLVLGAVFLYLLNDCYKEI